MDSRLMPPSHFDPNEQDSLELTPTHRDDCTPTPVVNLPAVQVNEAPSRYLLRPDELSSPILHPRLGIQPVPQMNIGTPQNYMRQPEILPDSYQTLPEISKSQGLFGITSRNEYQPSQQNHPELIRLQAENEALKSIVQCRKAKLEPQILPQPGVSIQHSAQHTVIEHQTQHISRLHKDLEELKLNLSKKEVEMSQYESSVAAKEKENRKLVGSIELLETQLGKKDDDARLKDQELEDLRKIILELRTEKEELVACHIAEMNSAKQKYSEENEARKEDFRTKMKQVSSVHEEEKTRLIEELETLNEQHQQKIKELMKTHQVEIHEYEKQLDEVTASHALKAQRFEDELCEQKARCESLVKSLSDTRLENEKLQSDLKTVQASLECSKQECKSHLTKINQLQAYVGQQQAEDYERSQWKNHKQEYEESIVALQSEKESMTKTLELQNIRLQSITKILTTQEEAIDANTKALSSGNMKGNPVHIIIRRWREKVFELMVQCRYNEISMKSVEDKYKLAETDLKEELQEEKRVTVILENQLSECKAQLEIQQRENGLLFSKCENLSNKLTDVTSRSYDNEQAIVLMSEQVAKSTGQLCQSFQEKFVIVTEKAVYLEQRLVFANNRLRTLQDLLLRRENLWRAKIKGVKDAIEPLQCSEKDPVLLIERPDLVAEIERLTQERDSLSQKLSMDSATYESSTMQFKERESTLEKEIASIQRDLQNKTEGIVELKLQLDDMQEKLHDQERAVHNAKESAKLLEENQETAIEEKLHEAQEVWDAERRKLEKKLEESQREHARTVVTSRQSERIAIREKKRASENLEAITQDHKKELDKFQAKVKALKQDNNLLMTTLRQHGLVSTFKASRSKAKKGEKSCRSPFSSPNKHRSTVRMSASKEGREDQSIGFSTNTSSKIVCDDPVEIGNANVAEMLNDLVVLTENLLDDSD